MFEHYTAQLAQLETLFTAYCTVEEDKKKEAKEILIQYLNEQDMRFIQLVQVILYVGKNRSVIDEKSKEELFQNTMNAFSALKGWRTKEIEVSQMIYAIPLDAYFKKGIQRFKALQ